MATPEQLHELVGRIQAMEAREAEGRTREQTLLVQVQNMTTQLAAAATGGTSSTCRPTASRNSRYKNPW
eukprot:6137682-Amphidinium_carterae.1